MAAPVVFWRLGGAPFDDPGEGMHAEIARELALSRDPLRLTLNGVPYVDKPPLLYALVAAASAVGGHREATARAVPASAAVVAVAATAWVGARLLGGVAGVVAGLALLSSPGFFAYARYLRPDALFIAALAVGWALTMAGLAEDRRSFAAAGLAAFGVAALAKDPLGLLAPPLAIGAALAACGRARPVRRWLPWPGILVALVIGGGWWLAAAVATPGFGWYAVADNHVLNVLRARRFPDEDVPLSAGQFAAVALAGALPWVAAATVAVWTLARRQAWRDPAQAPWTATAAWAVGVLAAMLLSPFRLPHYALPAYPAIALLAARALGDVRTRAPARALVAVFGAIAAACLLAVALGGARFETTVLAATDVATRKSAAAGGPSPVPGWEVFRPLVTATALVCLAGAVAVPLAARRGRTAAALMAAATAVAVLPGVAAGLAAVSAHRTVKPLATLISRDVGPDDVLALEGPIEDAGALEWYSRRRPIVVNGWRSVLAFGATRAGAPDVLWDTERLWGVWRGPLRVWLVTGRPAAASIATSLPGARLVGVAGGRRVYVNR